MAQQRLIMAIERVESGLSRLERVQFPAASVAASDPELQAKHERLKTETQAAIREIDQLLSGRSS